MEKRINSIASKLNFSINQDTDYIHKYRIPEIRGSYEFTDVVCYNMIAIGQYEKGYISYAMMSSDKADVCFNGYRVGVKEWDRLMKNGGGVSVEANLYLGSQCHSILNFYIKVCIDNPYGNTKKKIALTPDPSCSATTRLLKRKSDSASRQSMSHKILSCICYRKNGTLK